MNFVERVNNRRHAIVRAEWADDIAAALLFGTGCSPADIGGRGRLERFQYEKGSGLIRKYWRGGWMQHVLRDRYLFRNRARGELQVHARLYELGLPVPSPLGAAWERCGPIYRGWFASHELPAQDLLRFLHANPDSAPEILPLCGATIRLLHDHRVVHADLQARNILVADRQIYLIDFDKARSKRNLTPLNRAQNLYRLRRSLRKNRMPKDYFRLICSGYGPELLPEWMGRILELTG